MKHFRTDKQVLKNCKIYSMLKREARHKHLSFHTPGHKFGAWDITELSFSDNLSCPNGVIAEAERDISDLLGSKKSFILTDGSTCGIFSMLCASQIKTLALPKNSHKSVVNACKVLGIQTILLENPTDKNFQLQPPRVEMNAKSEQADALFLTSPDYYGNVADLEYARALCDRKNKLLLIDGAHGCHLRFHKKLYAGTYADLWVDGVHKSLPALTQGAVVSARTETLAERLQNAVNLFRTTSPSYPIMASVEYAVKYPQNPALEKNVSDFAKEHSGYIYLGEDWTKLCLKAGAAAFETEKELEKKGIFAEFCDGNVIMFYLSPATSEKDFSKLKKELLSLFKILPSIKEKDNIETSFSDKTNTDASILTETEWLPLNDSENRICAEPCGIFPPCTPLIFKNEKISREKIRLLKKADNVFGLKDKQLICVFKTNSTKLL